MKKMKKKGQIFELVMFVALILVIGGFVYMSVLVPNQTPTTQPPANTQDVLSNNLVFNAKLNSSAYDSVSKTSGIVSGVTFDGTSAKFSGAGYIKYPYTQIMGIAPADDLSVSVCVKNDNLAKHSVYVTKGKSWTVENWYLTNATNTITLTEGLIFSNDTKWQSTGAKPSGQGVWQHVVMNYNKLTGLDILFNGVSLSKNIWIHNTINNNVASGLTIGNSETLTKGLVGSIKNVRVYNKPMSADQIIAANNECKGI